ncbi:MAG: hypothetical protein II533_03935 [Bacteroidales bacterium]|nr:hypothetical protein [Bacteroidales bacterium]
MINLTVILDSIAYPEGCFVATDWTPTGMTVPMAVHRYYITDHLGSTRVVLSNTGSILEDYYSPYGEKVGQTLGGVKKLTTFIPGRNPSNRSLA